MEAILGDLRRHESWILLALALVGVAVWLKHVRRRAARASGAPVNGG
jgi:hypothetical protein